MSSSLLSPIRRTAVVIGALLIAAGCTAPREDRTSPTASQPAPRVEASAAAAAPEAPANSAPQILGTTVFEPPQVSTMQPTGTVVGQKIQSPREDLLRLQPQLSDQNDQLQTPHPPDRHFAGTYNSLKA